MLYNGFRITMKTICMFTLLNLFHPIPFLNRNELSENASVFHIFKITQQANYFKTVVPFNVVILTLL